MVVSGQFVSCSFAVQVLAQLNQFRLTRTKANKNCPLLAEKVRRGLQSKGCCRLQCWLRSRPRTQRMSLFLSTLRSGAPPSGGGGLEGCPGLCDTLYMAQISSRLVRPSSYKCGCRSVSFSPFKFGDIVCTVSDECYSRLKSEPLPS